VYTLCLFFSPPENFVPTDSLINSTLQLDFFFFNLKAVNEFAVNEFASLKADVYILIKEKV